MLWYPSATGIVYVTYTIPVAEGYPSSILVLVTHEHKSKLNNTKNAIAPNQARWISVMVRTGQFSENGLSNLPSAWALLAREILLPDQIISRRYIVQHTIIAISRLVCGIVTRGLRQIEATGLGSVAKFDTNAFTGTPWLGTAWAGSKQLC